MKIKDSFLNFSSKKVKEIYKVVNKKKNDKFKQNQYNNKKALLKTSSDAYELRKFKKIHGIIRTTHY